MENVVTYLTRHRIDDARWNDCIANAVNTLPYAYTWYLDAVATNWGALILNDYEAVFPLPNRTKWGISYVYPPFFAQQLGIFSIKGLTNNPIAELIDAIPRKFKLVEQHLNYANFTTHPKYDLVQRVNLELSLNKPYAEIAKGYNQNTKRTLKKAEQNLLTLQTDLPTEYAIHFFQSNIGSKIENIAPTDFEVLKHLGKVLADHQSLLCYGVRNNHGDLLATGLYITTPNRIINLLPAISILGKETGASYYLMDQLIQQYVSNDMVLDFEGSMIEGVARFYRGFGAEDKPYWKLQQKRLPWYIRLAKY